MNLVGPGGLLHGLSRVKERRPVMDVLLFVVVQRCTRWGSGMRDAMRDDGMVLVVARAACSLFTLRKRSSTSFSACVAPPQLHRPSTRHHHRTMAVRRFVSIGHRETAHSTPPRLQLSSSTTASSPSVRSPLFASHPNMCALRPFSQQPSAAHLQGGHRDCGRDGGGRRGGVLCGVSGWLVLKNLRTGMAVLHKS